MHGPGIIVRHDFCLCDFFIQVSLAGTFNNWQPTPMNDKVAVHCWCLILDLAEGEHEYKFLVDGLWRHNPKDRTIGEGDDARNLIEVRRSDFEVFEALDNDCRDVLEEKQSRNNSLRQKKQQQQQTTSSAGQNPSQAQTQR